MCGVSKKGESGLKMTITVLEVGLYNQWRSGRRAESELVAAGKNQNAAQMGSV